jgi:hypothetical protein
MNTLYTSGVIGHEHDLFSEKTLVLFAVERATYFLQAM